MNSNNTQTSNNPAAINTPSRRNFLLALATGAALGGFLASAKVGSVLAADKSSSSSASSSTDGETSAAAASSQQDSTDGVTLKTKAELAQYADYQLEGDFVLGFDSAFPPYGYIGDDGRYTGFDLDLAAEVCSRRGWNLVLSPIEWSAKDALMNSGQISCIWNGFSIEGREDDYSFTDPYMENRQVVAVRADSGISSLEDLAGKVVLVQTDSAAQYLLEEGGSQEELAKTFAELQTIADYNTAYMELESGVVDAVASDDPVAQYNIGDRTDAFTILSEPLNSENFGVGFKKGNTDLAGAVQYTLYEMTEDGFVKELCDKYADMGISYSLWKYQYAK